MIATRLRTHLVVSVSRWVQSTVFFLLAMT